MMELTGKTAVVTGGSRGIGRAVVLKLAAQGANVAILFAGNVKAAEETRMQAAALGVRAESYQCDVSDAGEVKAIVAKVLEDFGSVDILVNNAGITKDNLVLRMTEDDFKKVVDTNLSGAFYMIKQLYPHFMKKRRGKIINISSVSGVMGNAGQANYSSAKAGMIGLTKSVARELAGRGVNCNAVAPGFVQTDMTDAMPEAIREEAVKGIPMKRMARPEDIANAVLFLASDCSDYITGEVLKVDGGLAM